MGSRNRLAESILANAYAPPMYQGPGDRYPARMTRPPPLPMMQGALDAWGCTLFPHIAPASRLTSATMATPYWAYSTWSGGGRIGSDDDRRAPSAGGDGWGSGGVWGTPTGFPIATGEEEGASPAGTEGFAAPPSVFSAVFAGSWAPTRAAPTKRASAARATATSGDRSATRGQATRPHGKGQRDVRPVAPWRRRRWWEGVG